MGLDIGSNTIKAVELQRRGSEIAVVGRPTVVATPARSVEGGMVVDGSAVAAAIGDLMAAGDMKMKKVIASVGGDTSVVVRITEVPRMAGKELEEAIKWELDRQTPFPIDQTFYDYQPIDNPDAAPDAPNMEVLIAVAQEDMVNAHVDTLMAAKLAPVAIDVEPLAIARCLVELPGGSAADQTIGMIHLGATSSMIMLARKGTLSFVRSIPTGGATLTQTIRQNFMGDETLSEQAKRQFANLHDGGAAYGGMGGVQMTDDLPAEALDSVFELSDPAGAVGSEDAALDASGATQLDVVDSGRVGIAAQAPRASGVAGDDLGEDEADAREVVYEAIAPTIVDIATEIRRSIDFYRRQHGNEEVDRLVLSGGSAGIAGLAEFIGAETGIATSVADPFKPLATDESKTPAKYLADIGPSMVVAVGLALRDMLD